jgi:hypothetical protein
MPVRRGWCLLLIGLMLAPAGCTVGKKKKGAEAGKEEIRDRFVRLQECIADLRTGETEKLWRMLSSESQASAAGKAKAFRSDFAKLDKEEQTERAKLYGATPEEIREKLSGHGYLRLMREFVYERYFLLVGAPVDDNDISLRGDKAVVSYTQDDTEHDKKRIEFVREEGEWRVVLSIP